uniref:Uncharacterized protein n=1 Tax=Anguilla anguilla TaxID=7936 RepID=A0A0E9QFF5_ANGAN
MKTEKILNENRECKHILYGSHNGNFTPTHCFLAEGDHLDYTNE